MPRYPQSLASWLQQARKDWATLAQIGVLVLGIIGGFLLPPPVGIEDRENKIWLRLAQFTIAVSVGLVAIAGRKWNRKKDGAKWWLVSLLFFVFSISAFFQYQNLTSKYTCIYSGKVLVVGSAYAPMGEHHVAKNPGISCQQLVFDFAGSTEKIWTKNSIDQNRLLLAATYISCLPLFTICIIGLIQALNSTAARK
jgi:hypothetical protein